MDLPSNLRSKSGSRAQRRELTSREKKRNVVTYAEVVTGRSPFSTRWVAIARTPRLRDFAFAFRLLSRNVFWLGEKQARRHPRRFISHQQWTEWLFVHSGQSQSLLCITVSRFQRLITDFCRLRERKACFRKLQTWRNNRGRSEGTQKRWTTCAKNSSHARFGLDSIRFVRTETFPSFNSIDFSS